MRNKFKDEEKKEEREGKRIIIRGEGSYIKYR
jgi:hypothetical protein